MAAVVYDSFSILRFLGHKALLVFNANLTALLDKTRNNSIKQSNLTASAVILCRAPSFFCSIEGAVSIT